ncbi:FMN-binding negative transcriptional regulator [Aeromicrobium sp.]|uniref:FMN-binding negative transcriptional regulator n=1 Tax=Aeromicrobium sp. TaxID=1871063 RepID=UPI002FC690A7
MRHTDFHATTDVAVVRQIIADNPWAMIVSNNDGELVASHYPFLLDDTTDELVLVTHVGRPDDKLHDFADREVLIVFQGQHGYVSPSWYEPGSIKAPTWNFSAVHCHGTPEILDAEANLAVLTKLVAHFERHVDDPMWLDQEWAPPIARGTVGLRIPIDRFTCKVKMSQDKDPVTIQNVIDRLREPGPYNQPHLADDMERARTEGIGYPAKD